MFFRRLSVVLLSTICMIACEDAKPKRPVPKKTNVAAVAETPQAAIAAAQAALPTIQEEPTHEYAYSPVGKRDPFRSVKHDEEHAALLKRQQEEAEAKATKDELPVENVRCGALCKWDLEQFKLVAIITGVSTPTAMLEAPDGSGFTVHRGTFIGKRNGKITQIRPGEIIVTEIYRDNSGVPQPNDIALVLPKSSDDAVELDGDKNFMNAEPRP